ncbi:MULTISPECIES: hypothetical protein [unclassified Nonomuraea]|uniref:hypothetical protein n=1 Tax=unclassified Nonomuraea TaxID=2593643 RepID=UPI0035BF06F7
MIKRARQRGTEVFLWSILGEWPADIARRVPVCARPTRLHAKERWPQLVTVHVRYHGQFAYVEGEFAEKQKGHAPMTAAVP